MDPLDNLGNMLGGLGTVFLVPIGFAYLLPPFAHHIMRRKPPGILNLTYAVITVTAIILGINLINSQAIHQSFNEYAVRVFLQGQVIPRTAFLLLATFVSLTFVLGNVIRSYFNLHRIEDADPADHFATFIANLNGWRKTVELLLRIVMAVAILFVEYQLVEMRRGIEAPIPLTRADLVLGAFHTMWHGTIVLYLSLLVWDSFLLHLVKDSGQDNTVRRVLTRQALPVHICGFAIASLMCSCRHPVAADWADFAGLAATAIATLGAYFLCRSLRLDYPIVCGAVRDLIPWYRASSTHL